MKYTSLTKAANPGYTNDDDTHLANQTGDMLTQLVKVQGTQYTIQQQTLTERRVYPLVMHIGVRFRYIPTLYVASEILRKKL